MRQSVSFSGFLAAGFLATALVLAGCDGNTGSPGEQGLPGDQGPPGEQGDPGASMGTIGGTVTNSLTGAALAGAAVMIDPAVDDAEVATGEDGTYSARVPVGLYVLTFEKELFTTETSTVSVVADRTVTRDVALVPTAPVVLDVAVDGDAVPGETLTASVTVTPLDGSAVETIAWSQSSGVAVAFGSPGEVTTTVDLADASAYKDELIRAVSEPAISEDELPPNVPLPDGEFPGGLQDRFQVVGLNPQALEEAAAVGLQVAVTTSSGTYTAEADVGTAIPWRSNPGLRNIPVGVPVLLHGKDLGEGAVYDWNLTPADGSSAVLTDAVSQDPYFTPDMPGTYTVTVTDSTRDPVEVVTLDITANTFAGAITGRDENGRPLSDGCTVCHRDGGVAPDRFTPWAQSGHAEILTDNINTSRHYSTGCFACHTVGYDTAAANGGIDDAAGYQDFLAEFTSDGVHFSPDPDNWTNMLNDVPDVARLANVQCENCHGPNPNGHGSSSPGRISLSSDVCAQCHGEPLRHGRFQQWQLSGHANYELAIDEGESGNCSRCHTGNGFLKWLPILLDDDPATDPLDNITVDWAADEIHPQTCVTCHDPHSVGTTTGVSTDATTRITGDTPPLVAGFQVFGAGNGAICMTCHNSRRGLRNDDTFAATRGDAARAPHGGPQTDVLMGQNAYLVEVGIRGSHSLVQGTCVNCHMEQTPPPDLLSYNQGGTNHTFFARDDICANCHGASFDARGVQQAFRASVAQLGRLIEEALLRLITDQVADGNTIDLNGVATISDAGDVAAIEFGEARGRQAITVTFADGTVVGPSRMSDVDVVNASAEVQGELYDFADGRLIKSGWNWNLVNNDGSMGIHNPSFTLQVLDASIGALMELEAEQAAP